MHSLCLSGSCSLPEKQFIPWLPRALGQWLISFWIRFLFSDISVYPEWALPVRQLQLLLDRLLQERLPASLTLKPTRKFTCGLRAFVRMERLSDWFMKWVFLLLLCSRLDRLWLMAWIRFCLDSVLPQRQCSGCTSSSKASSLCRYLDWTTAWCRLLRIIMVRARGSGWWRP